jgi:hypothetical protein
MTACLYCTDEIILGPDGWTHVYGPESDSHSFRVCDKEDGSPATYATPKGE